MTTMRVDATLQDDNGGSFSVTGQLTLTPTGDTPDTGAGDQGGAPTPDTSVGQPPMPDPAAGAPADQGTAPTTDPTAAQGGDQATGNQGGGDQGPAFPGEVLRRDDQQQDPNEDLRTWQQAATDRDITLGPVDGYFGPLTEAGVRTLQQASGVPVTGEIDETTWALAFAAQTGA